MKIPVNTLILTSNENIVQALANQLFAIDPSFTVEKLISADIMRRAQSSLAFPTNKDFVLVDASTLNSIEIEEIVQCAKRQNYTTAFISDSMKIAKKSVDLFYSIKKNLEAIEVSNYDLWKLCQVVPFDSYENVAIIGDVHEHVEALEQLLNKIPKNTKLMFVGDLFDKGNQTEKMLIMAERLVKEGVIIVRGNHESFVARRLKKEISAIANENELFPSLQVFKNDEKLAQRFLEVYEKTLPFVCVHTSAKKIYITHAPCYNRYLGKLDEKSQKNQRNFYFSSRNKEAMIKDLKFIEKEADVNHPLHIFGHVANNMKNIVCKNKYWLDTGAVYGHELTCALIDKEAKVSILSVKTNALTTSILFNNEK
jgi:calcineurin-like phosphoesterase family protein